MKYQDCQHMKNKEIKTVVPKLRFPEFGKYNEWKQQELRNIIQEFIVPMRDKPKDLSGEIPWCRIEDFDGVYLSGSKTNQGVTLSCVKNMNLRVYPPYTLLVSCSADLGRCAITLKKLVTNQTFIGLFPKNNEVNILFLYYLMSNSRQRLNSLSSGTTITYLSRQEFERFNIVIPQLEEQQKIADCLSSIDDLITSTVKKIEALKSHKKGLMQRLFPAKGKKVPVIRFSEFQNAGEWKPVQLSQCLLKSPEYGINAPAVPYSDKLPVYLRITDISDDGSFISEQKVSVARKVIENNYLGEGDIVLARTGASVGKSYKYRKKDGRLVFAGFLIRIQPDAQLLNSEFIYQFFHTAQYWKWVNLTSARSGQPGINGSEYSSMPLLLPRNLEEQQKIADCLSSLDDLITALTQKLEAFKTHKKGLMQQLFPDMNE